MDNLNPKQIQQMIELLQNMLPDEEQEVQEEVAEEEFESPIKTKSSRRPIQGKRKNLFDEMMESKLHKEDVKIDQQLSGGRSMPRNRPSPLVDVHCRVCGKKEQVNASIIGDRDRYKCNKCAVGAG